MKLEFKNIEGNIEVYMDCLRAICGETEGRSMIDLMCCFAPNTPKLGFDTRIYVDAIHRKLDHVMEQRFFCKKNVLEIDPHIENVWDVSICSDGIEHLTIQDGHKLIKIMEMISSKQILFTPTTEIFKMVDPENKDPEAHRSLWYPDCFPDYACIIFPDFHKVWNSGAFFFWRCDEIEKDFERVKNILSTKSWHNGNFVIL